MSTFGRRGSRESGWNWSRPPVGPGRPPPTLPLLPLAGAALLFVAIAAAFLAVWLSDGDESSPQDATATPVASATATRTPTPAPTATATPILSPTPVPTPAAEGPVFRLGAWDGQAWQFDRSAVSGDFREGLAVPFMLRVEGARSGDSYGITLRYTCRTLQFVSGFDRDSGGGPALATGGPLTALPDSTAQLPDDPTTAADDAEEGRLSLWGGSFGPLELADVTGPCAYERRLNVSLLARQDTLFLLWGAVVAPGAATAGPPLRVTVFTERGEQRTEIDPASVTPSP